MGRRPFSDGPKFPGARTIPERGKHATRSKFPLLSAEVLSRPLAKLGALTRGLARRPYYPEGHLARPAPGIAASL